MSNILVCIGPRHLPRRSRTRYFSSGRRNSTIRVSVGEEPALKDSLADDLAAVTRIGAVPTILEVVCRTTGLGFAAVARVTEDRWVACAVRDEIAFGLQPAGELQVETTICDEIRDSGQLVVIDNVAEDKVFCGHPTPRMYGFQSYISVPIHRPDGRFFGTLCGIDPRPARLNTPETVGMFKLFADLIGFHLDVQERLRVSETALLDERKTSELREQFIAVLGHDLRNPLASIDAGVRLLRRMPLSGKAAQIVSLMRSSASRMAGLIDNVLDFARGRLGGGFSVIRTVDPRSEADAGADGHRNADGLAGPCRSKPFRAGSPSGMRQCAYRAIAFQPSGQRVDPW